MQAERSSASNTNPTKLLSDEDEARFTGPFNKTSLVTMWIEPDEYQIVKFTFENIGLDFLPFRWLARVDGLSASMEMSQPFGGVWLPREITVEGGVTAATGTYRIAYARGFEDYRRAEVGARIRSYRVQRDPGR